MAQNGSADVPGMPPGGIDLSALHNVLSDPGIKARAQHGASSATRFTAAVRAHVAACVAFDSSSCFLWMQDMAEKIAEDPAFAQMTAALQQSMGGAPGVAPEAAGAGPAGFDTSKYMEAMGGVLQNPQFMEMAEKLGQQIMQVLSCCRLRQSNTLSLHMPPAYSVVAHDSILQDVEQVACMGVTH
jgi:hypothetical protein